MLFADVDTLRQAQGERISPFVVSLSNHGNRLLDRQLVGAQVVRTGSVAVGLWSTDQVVA